MPPVEDAGAPKADAGSGETETKKVAFAGTVQQPAAVTGCGCTSVDGATALLGLALLGRLARRRRHG
ncbi:MAG: hypothetical protein INH41_04815, partial [Myxococcaceae bacterium]|nr:hypothetical protein [Myxococcaceae bacterium]MCA3011704.1 hypothetical protein [Myxococcaceae bacterium]